MSSPNIRTSAINCANAQTNNTDSSVLRQPRTVYVDKEQYSINITPLEDVSKPTWKKQCRFDQLETAVLSLRNTHQVANLMELFCQEVPIYVDSAVQDSTKQMDKVLASVYNVDNLNRSAFLTTTSKQAQLKSEALSGRPEGILIFRFSFDIDPVGIDYRIKQRPTFSRSVSVYRNTAIVRRRTESRKSSLQQ